MLSCWSLIDSDEDVTVVTVFSGAPESGFVSPWDADSGVDSATRMAQRVAENRAALAVAGREAVDVGLPECGYPGGGGVPLDAMNEEHRVVRDAVLEVRPDARFYADQPYCQLRPDSELPDGFGAGLEPSPVRLSPEQRLRKIEALRCYAGELPKLERAFTPFLVSERLEVELFWR